MGNVRLGDMDGGHVFGTEKVHDALAMLTIKTRSLFSNLLLKAVRSRTKPSSSPS
jgi:hypothetical protein